MVQSRWVAGEGRVSSCGAGWVVVVLGRWVAVMEGGWVSVVEGGADLLLYLYTLTCDTVTDAT